MRKTVRNVAYAAVLGLVATLLTLSVLHTALGVTFPLLVVKSGSMRPVIEVGDIIIVLPVSPDDVRADPVNGDVIVFYRPGEKGVPGSIIVHRAVARVSGGFITKGDANAVADYWGPVPFDHLLGKWTGLSIPAWTGIGYISLFLRGEILYPAGPILVLLLIAVNIVLIVKDFTRSKGGGDGEGEPSADASQS
ncbi:MAG: signal peptidase I [Aigarchaeota archaeon]|jgi:signal peptidase|nr:signal peptidase I [Candidatus Caldarchaeales archaeon]